MSRLPQLEEELVAAAGRLGSPGRMVGPAARLALALAAVVVAVAAAGVVAVVDGGDDRQSAAAPPFPPDATLEDMLGIFRTPATPADDAGSRFDRVPDRQPGEDPAQARRVEWPGVSIFMWPMRDGVCYGVRGGGGCPPLDHIRREGVSVGVHSSGRHSSVHGVVVDGIDEVVVTRSGASDLTVPVRENFFFADLDLEDVERVQTVSWSYGGEDRSLDVDRFLERAVAPPAPPADEGEPVPGVEPLAESASDILSFTVAGERYRAFGFHSARALVCVSLADADSGTPLGHSCLSERLLPQQLEERPARLFAGGDVRTGFAREDVVEITPADAQSSATVILSEPWSPEPWEGKPIRFFFVFGSDPPTPGEPPQSLGLEVRLRDGGTVRVP